MCVIWWASRRGNSFRLGQGLAPSICRGTRIGLTLSSDAHRNMRASNSNGRGFSNVIFKKSL
jgi:hypothetical protein